MEDQVKIHFHLVQDENGYPPVNVESVWAYPEGAGHYRLDNVPFFASQATIDDVVEAVEQEGALYYLATVKEGPNSLLRVAYNEQRAVPELRRELDEMGCGTELCGAFPLVAVSVPPDVSLADVQAFLARGAEQGLWDYEEPILRQ